MRQIDIHADDFGESVHGSLDLLECIKAGKLDSISILANMSCFDRCVSLYRKAEPAFKRPVKLSVHVNIMEGSCLSDPGLLPDLVDGEGHFCTSWGRLFLGSWLPGRKRLKEQLMTEIRKQIKTVTAAFPEMTRLRIDSHQHTHMIPVVADALFTVIGEEHWDVEYIRDAKEPVMPFLKKLSFYPTYRPINFVKNMILNFCSLLLQGRFRKMGLEPMFLWGLVMSGRMDEKRVQALYSDMTETAKKKGRTLEILFHPGQVLAEEITAEFSQKDAVAFHISDDRKMEKQAVMSLTWR